MSRKYQNTHTGLRPGQLKKKYLRARNEDIQGGMTHAWPAFDENLDLGYSLPDERYPDDHLYGAIEEYLPYEICSALEQRVVLGDLVDQGRLESMTCPASAHSDSPFLEEKNQKERSQDLVEKIFSHLRSLVHDPADALINLGLPPADFVAVRAIIEKAKWSCIRYPHPHGRDTENYLESLLCVLLFFPFRIRPLGSWERLQRKIEVPVEPTLLISELAKHLYRKYPVPAFMENTFASLRVAASEGFRELYLPNMTQMVLYILFARGVKPSKLNTIGNLRLTPALIRNLDSVPEHLSFRKGLIWARLRSSGLNGDICTFLIEEVDDFDYWKSAYRELTPCLLDIGRWLQRHQVSLADEDVERVMNWHQHERWERRHTNGWVFPEDLCLFEKRGIHSVLELVGAYEEEIASKQAAENLTWDSKGWNHTVHINQIRFQFTELLNSIELAREGRGMHHCVGGYDRYCKTGGIAVFLVCIGKKRIATVEISTRDRKAVQVFGKANAKLSLNTYQAVKKWLLWVREIPRQVHSS